MTPAAYRDALNKLGLSPEDMAERLHLHRTKIYKRLAGDSRVPWAEELLIALMLRYPRIYERLTGSQIERPSKGAPKRRRQ
jgi:hypothetical protein